MSTAATSREAREVVGLGEESALGALRLAGVDVRVAATPQEVLAAWVLVQGCGLVVLTQAAADVLGEARLATGAPLTVVVPQ
jgi:hypothetical protein